MRAVVLAAGFGKRMQPLTSDRPKHLLPIAGKPLVRRVVENLLSVGISEVGVVVGYMADKVIAALSEIKGSSIRFIEQREQRGTADALLAAAEYLEGEGRFLLIYGDVLIDSRELEGLIGETRGEYDGGLIAADSTDASRFGVVVERDGLLLRVSEKPSDMKGPALVNAGVYVLPSEAVKFAGKVGRSPRGEYELTDVLNDLALSGYRILVKRSSGWWIDVGRPADLLAANALLLEKELGGSFIVEKGAVLGRGSELSSVYLGKESILDERSKLSLTVIMDRCRIGRGSLLELCLLLEGAEVEEGCRLRNCIVGEGARVGRSSELLGTHAIPVVVRHGARVGPAEVLDRGQ